MKIFVKQHQIVPVNVFGISLVSSVTWSPSLLIGSEQRHYAPAQFQRHIAQSHTVSWSSRALYLVCVAIEIIIALQGFDEKVVHWKRKKIERRLKINCSFLRWEKQTMYIGLGRSQAWVRITKENSSHARTFDRVSLNGLSKYSSSFMDAAQIAYDDFLYMSISFDLLCSMFSAPAGVSGQPVDQNRCSWLPDICKDDMVVRMRKEKGHTTRQVQRVSTLILALFSFSRIQYRHALEYECQIWC